MLTFEKTFSVVFGVLAALLAIACILALGWKVYLETNVTMTVFAVLSLLFLIQQRAQARRGQGSENLHFFAILSVWGSVMVVVPWMSYNAFAENGAGIAVLILGFLTFVALKILSEPSEDDRPY